MNGQAEMHREPDVDSLLREALERPSEARSAFLDAHCANDEVRLVLDMLLRESDDDDPFLKPGGAFEGPLVEEFLAEPDELAVGARLGPYEIVGLIAAGGMGEVYRAHDTRLAREVAIKVLPRSSSETIDALARFEREARAVAALNHPNILALHDVGTAADVHFVVTELLEGETLRQRIAAGGPLTPGKAMEYGLQIANGLAAAHARGIVHRDLKPDNVFVTRDGRVKILDFGIASYEGALLGERDEGARPITRTGLLVGTVGYVSPEQLLGEPATPRSDLFAFGVVMYEMLTGTHPFRRATTPETQTAVLREDPAPVARAVPGLAPAVARVIERCLEKRPADRPETARDLALFLEVMGKAEDAAPVSGGDIDIGFVRRSFAWLLAVSCGLLLLLTGAAWGLVRVTADRAAGEAVEAELVRAERVVRRLHEERLTRLGLTARFVASFPELKALFATDHATVQDFLLGYQQRIAGRTLLVALGPDGSVLAYTGDARAMPIAGAEEWFSALVTTLGEGAVVAIGDRPHIAVAVASEAGGTVFGYLVAAEPVDEAFAGAVSAATEDEIVLLSDRAVLASTLRAAQTPWQSLDGWHASGGRADRSVDLRIGPQRFAAREVTINSSPAVSAIIVKSRDDAIAPYLRLQRWLVAIGLLAVTGAVLGGVWFSRMVTRRLHAPIRMNN
ncbi:MAG TPA: serine/threonine-protein kinase [Vicinamibacterales bacterium]